MDPEIKVIKLGTCLLEATELASSVNMEVKSRMGIGGGSSVVLIESDRRILVDTGFDYERLDTPDNDLWNAQRLITALKEQGLEVSAIDAVFITHWHRDHYGNLGLFQHAEHFASQAMVARLKLDGFTGLSDRQQIARGVTVLLTPGHTEDHASLLVDTSTGLKVRTAIAGDAIINLGYFESGKIWIYNTDFYRQEEAKQSIRRLVQSADVIVPGHGSPFLTYRPPWFRV